MRVVVFNEEGDERGGVLGEVEGAQAPAERKVAVEQGPFGQGAELLFGVVGEDGLAAVEEVDSAAELACPRFGGAVGAFGDDADDTQRAAEEGEDLGGFA